MADLVHGRAEKRRDMAVGPHVAAFGHLRDRVLDLRDERLHVGRGLVGLRLDLVHGHDERPAPRGIGEPVICVLPGQQGHIGLEHAQHRLLSPGCIKPAGGFQVVEQGNLIDRIARLVHGADGAEQRPMVGPDEIVLEQHREDVLANVPRAHAGRQDDRLLPRGDDGACRLGFCHFGFSRHGAHHLGDGMHANRIDSGACCHLPVPQGAWGTPCLSLKYNRKIMRRYPKKGITAHRKEIVSYCSTEKALSVKALGDFDLEIVT